MQKSLSDRFFEKMTPEPNTGCWLWDGAYYGSGYGVMQFLKRGQIRGAHRISWYLHHGEIPDGLFVCHRCDVKACVNPEHLYLANSSQNLKDAVAKIGNWRGSIDGEKNPNSKLTERDVQEIRELLKVGELMQKDIALLYDVKPLTISRIKRGVSWKRDL